jgi:hypothetical protein
LITAPTNACSTSQALPEEVDCEADETHVGYLDSAMDDCAVCEKLFNLASLAHFGHKHER